VANHIRQQPIPETELATSISRYFEDPSGSHQSGARCTPRHLICTADNARILNGIDLAAFFRAPSKRQFVKSITRQSLVDTIPLLSMAHTLQR
jgi:hypothetical protein